ncbi:MAG: OmpA family protein, partial [Pseudomonadota bacterium]
LQTEAETYRDTSFRFDNGAEFLAADAAGIDEFVSRLADFSTRVSAVGGTLTVSIVGYTDAIGTPERNVAVAEGRVDAARSKLLDAGINAEWISTTLEVDTGSAQTMEPEKRRVGVDVTDIRFP